VRVFVSEFLSGGAWPELCAAESMLAEGKAMLAAIANDMSHVPQCHVVTTHDARIAPFVSQNVESICVSGLEEERRTFARLASECDATFVIAPEFDQILANRCRWVEDVGGRLLGSSLKAVELCSDKLQLAAHFLSLDIPTIASARFDIHRREMPFDFPVVLKPRDGAGSVSTFLVTDASELEEACRVFLIESLENEIIVQPFIAGTASSVAVVCAIEQSRIDLFPPGIQHLSQDGRFGYLGGTVPSCIGSSPSFERLIRRVIESIPGLEGYIGIDFIVPENRTEEAVIVEVNPRLTTSYLGYRRLANCNLAERLLVPTRTFDAIDWKDETVVFSPESRDESSELEKKRTAFSGQRSAS